MPDLPIRSDLSRLIELLNDAIHFAVNSKAADTRVSRSVDALQRIIPAIREVNPQAVPNLDHIQAYFVSVVRAAETVEFVQKACSAKQLATQDRCWSQARESAQRRGATDYDFRMIDARDPRTNQVLSLSDLNGDVRVIANVEIVEPKVVSNRRGDDDYLEDLLHRDHTLRGGIIWGLDGFVIDIQARAIEVLRQPTTWRDAVTISGLARGAVGEVLNRVTGAFAKFQLPLPQVEIMINLAPADLPKEGTSLDLPLAIIMLQASGFLPDLPKDKEGDFILMGELGLHGEIRRVPGSLSLAYVAKPGQSLIVPAGNEKECALILAKPGHEGCRVYPVATLNEVVDFFQGKRKLENALKQQIAFENAVEKAVDFGRIKGQTKAKQAAVIAAAGGHNLLML